MKATTIIKISPSIELTTPTLLQCKSGECGICPNNTGKLLWIPPEVTAVGSVTLNFQYNFFDKAAESTNPVKYNVCTGFNTLTSANFTYSSPPNKAWSVANNPVDFPNLSPALMRGTNILISSYSMSGTGGWIFFRQPNPAIANVHDALCFEYNNEKRLITFRSF